MAAQRDPRLPELELPQAAAPQPGFQLTEAPRVSAPMDGAVAALRAAIAAGQVSPVELTEACLRPDRGPRRRSSAPGSTSTASARSPRPRARAEPGPLHGVPFGVKDVFNTQ